MSIIDCVDRGSGDTTPWYHKSEERRDTALNSNSSSMKHHFVTLISLDFRDTTE